MSSQIPQKIIVKEFGKHTPIRTKRTGEDSIPNREINTMLAAGKHVNGW